MKISKSISLGCMVSAFLFTACIAEEVENGPSTPASTDIEFELQRNSSGDLEYCDENELDESMTCESMANPMDCAVLIVTFDTQAGSTCERCENEDGGLVYESCENQTIACEFVSIPNPPCVVCAEVGGDVVYSTCNPPSDEGCYGPLDGYYENGEGYGDECDSCTCYNGQWECEHWGECGEGEGCYDENSGGYYQHGDTFYDGCNDCECYNGQLSCTLRYCEEECSDDADCNEGQYCEFYRYYPNSDSDVPEIEPYPEYGECVWFSEGCSTDAECAENEHCQIYGYGDNVLESDDSGDNNSDSEAPSPNAFGECVPNDGSCYTPYGYIQPGEDIYLENCNYCVCNQGDLLCEEVDGCMPYACIYDGQEYYLGESFPAGDGCNTCFCDEYGEIGCTEMDCGNCNEATEECDGLTEDMAFDPDGCYQGCWDCSNIDCGMPENCSEGYRPFEIACGCGICILDEGRCAENSDCGPGQSCVGSSLCPQDPDIECVWAGEPGFCESEVVIYDDQP